MLARAARNKARVNQILAEKMEEYRARKAKELELRKNRGYTGVFTIHGGENMAKRCEHCKNWKPQGSTIGTNKMGWPVRAGACDLDGSTVHLDFEGNQAPRHSLNYACEEYRPARPVGFEKESGSAIDRAMERKWGK